MANFDSDQSRNMARFELCNFYFVACVKATSDESKCELGAIENYVCIYMEGACAYQLLQSVSELDFFFFFHFFIFSFQVTRF